jgi:hypothetical protein
MMRRNLMLLRLLRCLVLVIGPRRHAATHGTHHGVMPGVVPSHCPGDGAAHATLACA